MFGLFKRKSKAAREAEASALELRSMIRAAGSGPLAVDPSARDRLERAGLVGLTMTEAGMAVAGLASAPRPLALEDIEAAMELRTWADLVSQGVDTSMVEGETVEKVLADRHIARLVAGGYVIVDPITGSVEPTELGWKAAGYHEQRQKPTLTVVPPNNEHAPSPARTKKQIAREHVERLMQPVRQAELVRQWGVSKGTASEWLSEWDRQGVVRRTADQTGGLLVQSAKAGRLRVVGEQPNSSEPFGKR